MSFAWLAHGRRLSGSVAARARLTPAHTRRSDKASATLRGSTVPAAIARSCRTFIEVHCIDEPGIEVLVIEVLAGKCR
jgi:hypothetical protein